MTILTITVTSKEARISEMKHREFTCDDKELAWPDELIPYLEDLLGMGYSFEVNIMDKYKERVIRAFNSMLFRVAGYREE